VLASLVASSKRHGVDPFAYLQGRPDANHAHTGESARWIPAGPLEGGPRGTDRRL